MTHRIPRLGEAFASVEGLYVTAEYREIPGYRYIDDAKPHAHDALAKNIVPGAKPFDIRHWILLDVYDSEHMDRMMRLAADYGMNGIQFSEDAIYWVNDSLHRYNSYVFTGELCERCHDLGLKAYFWTHEINGFFYEFTKNAKYGFYGQLAEGKIDLSSTSGFWETLYEKYDVFLRRIPGVDGLVLTLNESHIPVYHGEFVDSDLSAAERVARIGRTVKAACDAHGKHLILRTFCYTPTDLERVRDGVKLIGSDVTVMNKCVPHDWQTFYPHDPLIAYLSEFDQVVEFDLAHEPMGAGRFPYPDTDHIKYRIDHAAKNGVIGVAGRVERFRNHSDGTLNWSNVYAFSRLAQAPETPADTLWREYSAADFGAESAEWITDLGRRLFAAGQQVFFLGKEWASAHSNMNSFDEFEQNRLWNRSVWSPEDPEAAATVALLAEPTPEFISQVQTEKDAALSDLQSLRRELESHRASLCGDDYDYLSLALDRSLVMARALTIQHVVMLMVRHDARRQESERRYTEDIARNLAALREMAVSDRKLILDGGNEGNQFNPEIIERFCRNAERYLGRRVEE